MKCRFGFTIGPDLRPDQLADVVDDLERLGFDSVWVPEILTQPLLDPLVALAFAAGRTERLGLGTHLIIPGRNPVLLGRQLAHLDAISGGRVLLIAVLGLLEEVERGAQGIAKADRGADLEEVVGLMRRLWSGEAVVHDSERHRLDGVSIAPLPVQDPLEIWFSGSAGSALDRAGRLGDGWMPGFITPEEAVRSHGRIEAAAAGAGRTMDPEHYGVNLTYATAPLPDEIRSAFAARRSRTAGGPVPEIPVGMSEVAEHVERWLAAGHSKFLLRPIVPPADYRRELEMLASEILPLTT